MTHEDLMEEKRRDAYLTEYSEKGEAFAEPLREVVNKLDHTLNRFVSRLESLYGMDNETEYPDKDPDSEDYTASDRVEHDLACEEALDSLVANTASIATTLAQIGENVSAPPMSDDDDYGCVRDKLTVIKLLLEYGTDEEKEWAMVQLRKIKDSTLFVDWSKVRIFAVESSSDGEDKYDE